MTHVARIIFAQKFSTHSHTHFHTEIANDHKHTKSNNLIVPLNSFQQKKKLFSNGSVNLGYLDPFYL